MADEFDLGPDAKRALREAENFCWRANVAIVAADHLLCGALSQVALAGIPGKDTLERALETIHGRGISELSQNVMFGSGARDALSSAVREARAAGNAVLDARGLAAGIIRSGEVNPMFYATLGVSREALLAALGADR